MNPRTVSFSTSQAISTIVFGVFALILLNGYLLNLVLNNTANSSLVLLGTLIGWLILFFLAQGRVRVERDAYEAIGFAVVVVGVWLYFVVPSLPTLLPPTHSSDAVRHYLQMLFSFPEGKLVSWYPAGGAFVAATFAHWFFTDPLYVLHPIAALFIALSAGAVYGVACAWLPKTPMGRILALFAPAMLFVPWSYFAGILIGEQYFFAQAFAHYFIVLALWFTASYAEHSRWIFAILVGAALVGVVVAYPILVPIPFVLFGLVVLVRFRSPRALIALAVLVALLLLAGFALERGGILELKTAQISTTGEVGEGGVATPSLDTLGGPVFLALAGIGIFFAWRSGVAGKTVLAFLLAWILQVGAFAVIQPFFPISSYRVDKSFYILAYPLALLAALPLARLLERVASRFVIAPRVAMIGATIVLMLGVLAFRPPRAFTPFDESELQTARWAKENLNTYDINYLDPDSTRAYWLAFGLWRETVPNEWFQWIPAGVKLGPASFDEWLGNSAWSPMIFVRDVGTVNASSLRIVYRNGVSAILEKKSPEENAPTPAVRDEWYFRSTIKLLGYDLAHTDFAPGEQVTLTTYAQSIYPPPDTMRWRVELVNRAGDVMSQAEADPFKNKYPLQRWRAGVFARDVWTLPIPANASPGAYAIRIGLFRRTDGEFMSIFRLSSSGAVTLHVSNATLAPIKIPLPAPSADDLSPATLVNVRVGKSVVFHAYRIQRNADQLRVKLFWQGFGKSDRDYTVFVHLLDASGNLIAQHDAQPANGIYPTSIWDVGEIVGDEHTLAIPANAPEPFSLIIGMYDATTGQRLPIGDSDKIKLQIVNDK
jgi:hypothetical protein